MFSKLFVVYNRPINVNKLLTIIQNSNAHKIIFKFLRVDYGSREKEDGMLQVSKAVIPNLLDLAEHLTIKYLEKPSHNESKSWAS